MVEFSDKAKRWELLHESKILQEIKCNNISMVARITAVEEDVGM